MIGHIYCITNLANGKKYVGKTTGSIASRWKSHCKLDRDTVLTAALKKYGPSNFGIDDLGIANSKDELNNLEREWIAFLNTRTPNGYNLMFGGEGGPHAPEVREKMRAIVPLYKERQRQALREYWAIPENRKRLLKHLAIMRSKRGPKRPVLWTDEQKLRHSEQRKQIWKRPEYRAKLMRIFSDPAVKAKKSKSIKIAWKGRRSASKGGSS